MRLKMCMLAGLSALLIAAPVFAHTIVICHGEYALCAGSATTPTGKTMKVGSRTFREGVAICPILKGDAVADLDLMNGSCDIAKGKVWSLFGVPAVTEYPQAPSWAVAPAQFREFTVGTTPTTGMSNMWSYPCEIQAQPVNGTRLASCYGPIMESPWAHRHVKPGEKGFTQAATGSTYPVGGNAPQAIAPAGN
jgi:hypothetical protein